MDKKKLSRINLQQSLEDRTNIHGIWISPSGKVAILAEANGILSVWDLTTGEIEHTLHGHNSPVTTLAFISEQRIISAGEDMRLRVWDIATSTCLQEQKEKVNDLCIRNSLVIFANNHEITVSNIETGEIVNTWQTHTEKINSVSIRVDGKLAVSAADDYSLRLWDVATGALLSTFYYKSVAKDVDITDDGLFVISGHRDCLLRVCNLLTGEIVTSLYEHWRQIKDVRISQDGSKLVSIDDSNVLCFWNLSSQQCLHKWKKQKAKAIDVCDNWHNVITAGDNGQLFHWFLEWELAESPNSNTKQITLTTSDPTHYKQTENFVLSNISKIFIGACSCVTLFIVTSLLQNVITVPVVFIGLFLLAPITILHQKFLPRLLLNNADYCRLNNSLVNFCAEQRYNDFTALAVYLVLGLGMTTAGLINRQTHLAWPLVLGISMTIVLFVASFILNIVENNNRETWTESDIQIPFRDLMFFILSLTIISLVPNFLSLLLQKFLSPSVSLIASFFIAFMLSTISSLSYFGDEGANVERYRESHLTVRDRNKAEQRRKIANAGTSVGLHCLFLIMLGVFFYSTDSWLISWCFCSRFLVGRCYLPIFSLGEIFNWQWS